ncbi:MAG: gamma-glutamyl-gamma-aminobutyrate hydrolase family protein [Alphaproteobacteria bacterium]|nr:gamma-glutamyl-gamma-aminobutyrate hydrolase family protein [Alphaproteobacteria bacterium]
MRPLIVGIPCDYRMVGPHPFHMAGDKYARAVRESTGAVPLLIPSLGDPISPEEILACVDGLLFTGSPSNVAPRNYNGQEARENVLADENRDATTLPLLKAAIAAGVPVLCLCRGFQELNVAMGGTLHQHIQELAGRIDHREDHDADLSEQYGPAHEVCLVQGGLLGRIIREKEFRVNSLHSQGIDRIAPTLHADALAPDGTIEAVSMPKAKGFVLGLQWHPEWRWSENPVSREIFGAFSNAIQNRAEIRR